MGSVDEASWLVENLNGTAPRGLAGPVSISFSYPPRTAAAAPRAEPPVRTRSDWAWPSGKGGGKEGFGYTGGQDEQYGGSRYEPYGGNYNVASRTYVQKAVYAPKIFSSDEGSTLFVQGLPSTVDELYLYKVFAPFGAIQNVKPMAQEAGGTGLVKFKRADEAQAAISAVNGRVMADGSQLQVSIQRVAGKGGREPALAV